MKYIYMNCLTMIKMLFVAAMLATPFMAVSADEVVPEVSKVSCALYDVDIPSYWISKDSFDADGMPPVRGALLLDAVGGQTKCHLNYQYWQYLDKNHLDDIQGCSINSYILPSGDKPDFELAWGMIDRSTKRYGSKWIKIEGGYMKSAPNVKNEGMKVGTKGLEKNVNYDREIVVVREGPKYVHVLSISVPESRYGSDVKFRRMVDNVWKSWKLKK